MTATAMTNRKFAMGLLTGMVISLITNGIYLMQTSSTFYSGKVYKVNLPGNTQQLYLYQLVLHS